MSFNLKIDSTGFAEVASGAAKVRDGLQAAKDAATDVTTAVTKLGDAGEQATGEVATGAQKAAGGLADLNAALGLATRASQEFGQSQQQAAEFTGRELAIIESLNGPSKEWAAQLEALNRLNSIGAISTKQYEDQLIRLQSTYGAVDKAESLLAENLQREAKLLESIKGPIREYEKDLLALDNLLKRGAIDAADYHAKLEQLNKRAQSSAGPLQGPTQQTGAGGHGEAGGGSAIGDVLQAVAPQAGAGGSLIGQFASGGTVAVGAVAALGVELVHLGDQYRELTNQVERFTSDNISASAIISQQIELSKELHSSLEGAAELYIKVHEATMELNLSSRQQLTLAHDLGVEVAAEGKSAEAAAGLMQRLSLAFETGTISGRELRAIMKQFPELGTQLADAMGHSTSEMLQLANKGQISAQQLIDALHKLAPEAEKTLGMMPETIGGSLHHMWDEIKVGVGSAVDAMVRAQEPAAEIAASVQRHVNALRELSRQTTQELERNARTAEIAAAAQSVGINIGPFDKAAADSLTEARMTARAAGIDISQAFSEAYAKAQQYGLKIEEIKNQHAAKEIAEDTKRIYEAMAGVDDIMKTGFKRWQDMSVQIQVITKAIERWKDLTPAGVPTSQEQRDLELQRQNLLTDQSDSQYGKKIVTYAQGLNTARAELEALNRAHKDGVIVGQAYRQQYDQLMTTLNDGRLPEVIKLWESIHDPIDQASRDFRAIEVLLRSGRVEIEDYVQQLKKISDTGKEGNARVLEDSISKINIQFEAGQLSLSNYEAEIRKLDASFAQLHRTASGIAYQIAPDQRNNDDFKKIQDALRTPPVSGNADVKSALEAARQPVSDMSTGLAVLNKQLDDEFKISNQIAAPLSVYEEKVKVINAAIQSGLESREEGNVLLKKAREEYDNAAEALQKIKGPQEQYAATLLKLNDELARNSISEFKYAQGVDAAKIAMLQATGAAETFSGALQIDWLKAKQGAESFGASTAHLFENDLGKFNDNVITALTGGGAQADQARQALAQLQQQYGRGAISAAEYSAKYKELSRALADSTDIWRNVSAAFSSFVDSMIADIERLIIKWLEMQAIKGIVGLFSNGSGAAGAGDAVSGASGGTSTDVGSLLTELGYTAAGSFAEGGSFKVAGSGGVDSQPVFFRASPGESVTVSPPGMYPYFPSPAGQPSPAQVGGGGSPQIVNVFDHSAFAAYLDSAQAGQTIVNHIRREQGPIRSFLGISSS